MENLDELSLNDLREKCRSLGISKYVNNQTKAQLKERILEHQQAIIDEAKKTRKRNGKSIFR